ncbi:MAG: hypothetical protein WBO00_09010, partial [Steroidobacteraceae bacterium]
ESIQVIPLSRAAASAEHAVTQLVQNDGRNTDARRIGHGETFRDAPLASQEKRYGVRIERKHQSTG